MGNTLYLDCFAGISGDMAVGCLLDLGASPEKLQQVLSGLSLEGFETVISRVKKSGLDMCDFAVLLDEVHENHDHDMEYLHGNPDGKSQAQQHFHGHQHDQNSIHVHSHRGLTQINTIIREAQISERAKEIAIRIFDILGDAEAKAHGIPKEQVHFHEVGAVDSIVDIIAVAVCLDDLDVTDVIVPFLCEGRGMVRCQHGMMPVPVPAVVSIASSHCLTLQSTDVEGELVTPTGAAIVAAVKTADALPKHYRILASGMGAGKRNYSRPSILRGMLIEEIEKQEDGQQEKPAACGKFPVQREDVKEGRLWKLESNIDDTAGEGLGYVMELLMENGARDVHYIPVYMKKNRPAYLLNVICDEESIDKLENIIFVNTTTIGIRRYPVSRSVLPRRILSKETSYGAIRCKECTLPDGKKRLYPEYESVRAICREKNLPYREVCQQLFCEL